jgi:ribosome assembly protein 3
MTDAEVSSEFTKFYLARATKEFEDDLDKLRSTTDFRDEHLGILVDALKQGTSLFGTEEKRKIVLAGKGE